MKLTKTLIDRTEPGEKDLFLWDQRLSGFGLRIKSASAGGARSFVAQYRFDGKTRRTTLGRFGHITVEQARKLATRTFGQVAEGRDPVAEERDKRSGGMIADLADRYLEEHARARKKPSSVKADECNVRNHVKPRLGELKIKDVKRQHIAKLHHDMRETPGAANRVLALLSKMFNLAELWGLRPDGSNPCRHVERYPERKVERFLSEVELASLGSALSRVEAEESELIEVIAAIRLLIFTGCRLGEILSLRWDFVDFDHRALRLPDTKTGAKSVPLNEPALAILLSLDRGSEWTLPGRVRGQPLKNIHKPWARICEAAGIENLRLHDLRHSFASIGAGAGMSLHIIGRLLGHAQTATTQRYAHLQASPLLQASEKIAAALSGAMQGAG